MKSALAKKIDKEAILEQYLEDFQVYAEDCLVVRDHSTKQLLPFIFNNPQRILHIVVEKQRSELGYVRILLDKARRFGGSTYVEGRGYWKTSMNFNINAFIVAHEEDSTDTLFSMARLFHERNPLKPQTKYSSKKELLFDNKAGTGLKSEYSLACASNTSAGRSQGIHFLHGSEVAYWEGDPDELLDGLMSCISNPMDTEVYLESTGNGYGNRFQRDVFDAYSEGKYPYYQENGITYAWKRPGSDWVLVFIPWFAHTQYSREFDSDQQKHEFESLIKQRVFNKELLQWEESEDIKLQKKYGLTLEQLHWRRWKIEDTFKGRIEKFRQEFPATVEESFLSKGSNVYPKELCDMIEAACNPPVLVGDVVDRLGKTKIRPNPNGHFSIWERPSLNPEDTYFITVDSAGGKNERQKAEKQEPDYTNIDVFNHRTGRQAAQWHGHIDYDLIADVVELIGNLYFRAVACVALLNHGYTAAAGLKNKKYPMYENKPGEPGWIETGKSKPQMIDGLYEMARDGSLQIQCRETVSEMRTFVEENGKYGAESGCKDDRVTTAAIASQMMRLLPRRRRATENKAKDRPGISNFEARRKPRNDGSYREIQVR
jgi:hypothetical protein